MQMLYIALNTCIPAANEPRTYSTLEDAKSHEHANQIIGMDGARIVETYMRGGYADCAAQWFRTK